MMITLHEEAEAELAEAVFYFEERKPGLGKEFITEVLFALNRVKSFPRAWPLITKNIRRCLVNRFP